MDRRKFIASSGAALAATACSAVNLSVTAFGELKFHGRNNSFRRSATWSSCDRQQIRITQVEAGNGIFCLYYSPCSRVDASPNEYSFTPMRSIIPRYRLQSLRFSSPARR